MKAKVLAKMRYFTKADKLCQDLIDTIRDLMNKSSTPAASTPAAAAIPSSQTENVEATTSATVEEPKMFWKFAVKAAYLKAIMLAG